MSTTGKILVTGATGNNGSALIQSLMAMGANVRALVHDEAKAKGLREAGVEVVIGDYLQPETLDAAKDCVDRLQPITAAQHSVHPTGGSPRVF